MRWRPSSRPRSCLAYARRTHAESSATRAFLVASLWAVVKFSSGKTLVPNNADVVPMLLPAKLRALLGANRDPDEIWGVALESLMSVLPQNELALVVKNMVYLVGCW